MKIVLYIVLFCAFSACKREEKIICNVENYIVKDTLFNKANIISSIYYDNNTCKISKLELVILLDSRSGIIESAKDIKNVTFKLGVLGDTLISGLIDHNKIRLKNRAEEKILLFDYSFDKPFLDSINIIDIQTISLNKKSILKSESYFYKNTAAILEIENSYLDYKAFNKTNFKIKDLSSVKKQIDSILVTFKHNGFIDDLTKFNITINDTLDYHFRNSIKASYNNFKLIDKNVQMFNYLKMNKYFLTFKLDLHKINLKSIDSINVNIN